MQNDCKNNKSSEIFEVVGDFLHFSDEIKSEKEKKTLEDVVNELVARLNLNELSVDKLMTAAFPVSVVNRAVEMGEAKRMVTIAERLKEVGISSIAEEISAGKNGIVPKVVLIAGPSSSGKTTFCKKMAYALGQQGLKPVMLSIDDYYGPLELTPKDETGDYDFESIYALDLDLFRSHLQTLVGGGEVKELRYNFAEAKREFTGKVLRMESDNILLIEGIHGLNPLLTGDMDSSLFYRIYISGSSVMRNDDGSLFATTDNRLVRRMVRDSQFRGTTAQQTIARWQSVRRGEEKWIVPFQLNADANFNTSFPYELGILRRLAIPLLEKVQDSEPEYEMAAHLLTLLRSIHQIDANLLHPYSILREFVGGSRYEY